MKRVSGILILAIALAVRFAAAQATPGVAAPALPVKTTFVRLGPMANAILVEPVTPNQRSRIAVLITHPERVNNFNYFIGLELPKYGYRAMMLNYYGKEETYYEFLQPLAAAINALRAVPGVKKVVLAGHSSGGAELSSYQDVAENGPAACQGPERIYKCASKGLESLPKADGLMLIDANTGAADKTIALNPAVNEYHPREIDPALDPYNPANGYDPTTHSATYSQDFLNRFFAAQRAKANRVIDEALDRLAKIDTGQGEYKDDEPFVVAGAGVNMSGSRLDTIDLRLMSRTHSPHTLLKGDGTRTIQIISRMTGPQGDPYKDLLAQTTMDVTVRHYLSFQALPVTSDYRITDDNLFGLEWRGTANSVQGNLAGIQAPTLIVAATCSVELVLLEISYDHSVAKDKEFVGVEGADHNFRPCNPRFGDTYKRTFDYIDGWLNKPGRF